MKLAKLIERNAFLLKARYQDGLLAGAVGELEHARLGDMFERVQRAAGFRGGPVQLQLDGRHLRQPAAEAD
mgnify:CR=1 FL=1